MPPPEMPLETRSPVYLSSIVARMRALSRFALRSNTSPAVAVTVLLLSFWASYTWVQEIERIVRYYTPLPTWDYWRVPQFLERYRALDLRVLWAQHNEHRIIFPEIVFATDMLFAGGKLLLPVWLSALCYLTNYLAIVWVFSREKTLSPLSRLIAGLIAAIVIGWEGSAIVIADPFLLQWTLTQVSVTLSLILLTYVVKQSESAYLVASIAFAEIATYSSGSGMLLWPVLILTGTMAGLPKRRIYQLAIAGVASIGVYFIGYKPTSQLHLQYLFLHPFCSLGFIGTFLSMPFGGMRRPYLGVALGILNIFTGLLLLRTASRKKLLGSRTGAVLSGIYIFNLLNAMLIAAGRMDPTELTFAAAEPSRYLTVPLVNWAVFILLLLWVSEVSRWRILSARVLCAFLCLVLLFGFTKLSRWLLTLDDSVSDKQLVTIAMRDGILDPNLSLKIFPSAAFVQAFTPLLQKSHLSVFGDRRSDLIGAPVTDLPGSRRLETGFGAITRILPLVSGLEVVGWADDTLHREHSKELVFVNEKGLIVGFGSKLGAVFPASLGSWGTPPSLGWVGFVNLSVSSTSFTPYLMQSDRFQSLSGPINIAGVKGTT